MSGDDRRPLGEATKIANEMVALLQTSETHIVVAGSVRRERATVGDIELVVMTDDPRHLLARLDSLVISGVVNKARYGDSYRWGEKYRGVMLNGMRCEIFIATRSNFGYILWLRTGPGDANTFVMKRLADAQSPYRAVGGQWVQNGKRLIVDTETEMFRLLGMPYLPPQVRSEDAYRARMRKWQPVKDVRFDESAPVGVQKTMF